MRAETPEEKFNHISGIVRNLMLTGYPNPDRMGCPGPHGVENLAKFTGGSEGLENQDHYEHVMYCSPCYEEYLDARQEPGDGCRTPATRAEAGSEGNRSPSGRVGQNYKISGAGTEARVAGKHGGGQRVIRQRHY
jgi:hypothetical protein